MVSAPNGAAPHKADLVWEKCCAVHRLSLIKLNRIGGAIARYVALCMASVEIYVSGSNRGSVTSLQPSESFERKTMVIP